MADQEFAHVARFRRKQQHRYQFDFNIIIIFIIIITEYQNRIFRLSLNVKKRILKSK